MDHDPSKLPEYWLRFGAAGVILALMGFALSRHGIHGPATLEIILIAGGFSLGTGGHALWMIWAIKKSKGCEGKSGSP